MPVSKPSVTEQEFNDWLQHPVTLAIKEYLKREIEAKKEEWASGVFTDQSQYSTAILNAKAIGVCEALTRVGELEFSQLGDMDA